MFQALKTRKWAGSLDSTSVNQQGVFSKFTKENRLFSNDVVIKQCRMKGLVITHEVRLLEIKGRLLISKGTRMRIADGQDAIVEFQMSFDKLINAVISARQTKTISKQGLKPDRDSSQTKMESAAQCRHKSYTNQ